MVTIHYIDIISFKEFQQVLKLFDIQLSKTQAIKILRCLRSNYELVTSTCYGQLLDTLIVLSDHHMTRIQAQQLIIYFKHLCA